MANDLPEQWKPVYGWESSREVSTLGRVRTVERLVTDSFGISRKYKSRLLSISLLQGYPRVRLCHNGIKKDGKVHVMVLESFVSPRPVGLQACHVNGNRQDNRPENLYWGTAKQNANDRVRHGTDPKGWRNPRAKVTPEMIKTIRAAEHGSLNKLRKSMGIPSGTFWSIRTGRNWSWFNG